MVNSINQTDKPTSPEGERQYRRQAVRITLVTGLILLGVSTPSLFTLTPDFSPQYIGNVITTVMGLLSLLSSWVSHRYASLTGRILFISTLLVISLGLPIYANGLGIQSGIITAVILISVAAVTFEPKIAYRIILISVVVESLVILGDLYLPDFGISELESPSVNYFLVLILIVFGYFVSRQFEQFNLRTKIVLLFSLIAILPLALSGVYSNTVVRNLILERGQQELKDTASQIATQADNYINTQLSTIRVEAQQPALRQYLESPAGTRKNSSDEENALEVLSTFVRKNAFTIHSYALLNTRGENILDTHSNQIGRSESQFDYFTTPLRNGQVFASSLYFINEVPYLYFSAPIRDSGGAILGILRAEVSPAELQNILRLNLPTTSSREIYTIVERETFVRIAYTGTNDKLHKSFKIFPSQELAALQRRSLLPRNAPIDVEPRDALARNLSNLPVGSIIVDYIEDPNDDLLIMTDRMDSQFWLVVVSQSEATLLQPIREQTRTLTVYSMLIIAFASLAGYLASQLLSRPLLTLANISEKIAAGDLNARMDIATDDEIGSLANSFNHMTSQLRDTLGGLERRVAERTGDVELARLLSERRAQELHSISEISRAISTEQRLEILLPLISRLVSERFDFYHVGIFFVDETHRFAYLQAANSEGGQKMLARGHRLEVGKGLVGTVSQTGKPRIALDVGSDAAFFDNPDLPETRSEMALPLNFHGQTIGVLDVQSTKPGAFTENDASTLGILADQVAIAIENARLFGQTQQARDEAEALYAQIQRREWSAFAQQETRIGYRQTATGGRRLAKPVTTNEIRDALANGQVVVLDGKEPRSQPAITVPVKLRGQTIGVLNIKAPTKDRRWNQDEINLAQAISDRLALALDNARLLQESQRRAAKEAKIGEVSAKIGASINMRNVLQTAVEELGRALPGSEVVIQFDSSGGVITK
ncbi:MAG TPA: GAF domain-containing protein [Anaerolineales bacterium]